MRHPAKVCTLLALGLAAAPAAQAQRLGVELAGGLVFPMGGAADRFDSGTQLGANLLVEVTPAIGVYGGYSQTELPVSDSDGEVSWKGFEGGVRISPAVMLGPVSPTLSLGATYMKPEVSGGSPAAGGEGERELGFRGGLGLDVPLGQVITASVGGSVTIDPYDLPPIPDCPPSDPDCDHNTRLQLTVGLRVYPPFLGRGPGR